jgi:Bifunctional DNA primase/polymerase, N-terminal/AAA domain/Primase C terminal 1 (PriCT-1)
MIAATRFAAAALGYARRGWRVFPVAGKVPRLTAWPRQATTDEATVRRWWRTWPTAGIGIATGGGLLVLDVDPRHGGDAALTELERQQGSLPDTPRVVTGGGGLHVYFAVDQPIANRAGLAPGIDLRGDGGYVVAPPSLHASGRRYAWELGAGPDDVPLSPAPAWLLARIREQATDRLRADGTPLVLREGERNRRLFQVAAALRRYGINTDGLRGCLEVVNREHATPPLDAGELATIAASAGRYPPAPLDDDGPPPDPPDSDDAPWPEDDDTPRPVVSGELPALVDAATPATATSAPRISRPLSAILADPGALEPPAVVVPRLAWHGRTTLLAAREKGGKSTFATAAAAALTGGAAWFSDPTPGGGVLWLALEEHVGDLARRMEQWRADPARVFVVDRLDSMEALHAEARAVAPTLIVVDTLSTLVDAIGCRPDPGSSTAWTPIMSRLARIARDTNAAVLVLHHARKSDGAYRDSSAIGAGVDVIVEMADGDDAGVRVLRVRGRWHVGDYSVRLLGDQYTLASGELSLDTRVLLHIEAHPGCSQRSVEHAIPARSADVRASIRRLLTAGAVRDNGASGAMRLSTSRDAPPGYPGRTRTHSGRRRDAPGRTHGTWGSSRSETLWGSAGTHPLRQGP